MAELSNSSRTTFAVSAGRRLSPDTARRQGRPRMRPALAVLTVAAVGASLGATTASATTPGRNGRLSCSSEAGPTAELFTFGPSGARLRQITNDPEHGHGAADWAPDGRRVVYERGYGEVDATIAIARPDGRLIREINLPGFSALPVFTPDGRHIVFERFLPPDDDGIWVMRDDGTRVRRLTRSPQGFGDTAPSVSPDGRGVAFVRTKAEGTQALFTMRADGSGLRQVTPFSFDVGVKQDWSPDGKRIVITRNANFTRPNTSANVVTIRPDGSGLRNVTHFTGGQVSGFAGSYSPDGRWIVYRREDHGAFSIVKVHPNGRGARTILDFPVPCRGVDWGPRARHPRG
jgi:Tol biopolymer transport system component